MTNHARALLVALVLGSLPLLGSCAAPHPAGAASSATSPTTTATSQPIDSATPRPPTAVAGDTIPAGKGFRVAEATLRALLRAQDDFLAANGDVDAHADDIDARLVGPAREAFWLDAGEWIENDLWRVGYTEVTAFHGISVDDGESSLLAEACIDTSHTGVVDETGAPVRVPAHPSVRTYEVHFVRLDTEPGFAVIRYTVADSDICE